MTPTEDIKVPARRMPARFTTRSRRVLFLWATLAGLSAGAAVRGQPPPTAIAGEQPPDALSVIRNDDTLAVVLRLPPSEKTYALRLHSDRNSPVARASDISPRQPPARTGSTRPTREMWYPVIDVGVMPGMEAVVELADVPEGTKFAWNGWVGHEMQAAKPLLSFSADRLLQWENILWFDRFEPRMTRFYLAQPFPKPTAEQPAPLVTLHLLTPHWSGQVDVVVRDSSGRESVLFSRRVEGPGPGATPAIPPPGKEFEPDRLRASLAATLAYTLRSRIEDPQSPMRGGLYLFYDLDARTFRTPHWIWGWGPSAGLLLEARKMPEMQALFGSDRLLNAAKDLGEVSLKTVSHDPKHPARGIPISRWERSPRHDGGHVAAITPCDAGFLAGWAWVRLWEATHDPKWLEACRTLAGALERLMTEFPIPPQNYWPHLGTWDDWVIDEAGFGIELFAEMYRVTGDERLRELGRRYIDQHLKVFARPDGLWERRIHLDGRPPVPTVRMTRGLAWPMEGLLAAHRLLPEGGRYLDHATRMADHLLAAQKPEGWWVHRFDEPVEEWGIGTKGTTIWCWLLYQLHRHTGDPRHLSAARRALRWLLDQQYAGEDELARGGHITVSPHSAVGYRPWYRVTCTYGAAFYGLALLEELKLQQTAGHGNASARAGTPTGP
jgi:rhamnogalacturonyl hydrolase YesR